MDNREEKTLLQKVAELSNVNSMMLYLLTAIIALSVGLAFFFLVSGTVGYWVGIAMFVVSGLLFVIGAIMFIANKMVIKRDHIK